MYLVLVLITNFGSMDIYKILLVDDSLQNLIVMESIFNNLEPNYQIFKISDSREVIDFAQRINPDLIISDWDMPHFCGINIIKKLKLNELTKDIPIIMVTGIMLSTEHLKTALDAGAIDYVRKPIEAVELIARTKAALLIATYYKKLIMQRSQELTESTLQLIKNQKYIVSFTKKLEKLNLLIDNNTEKAKKELFLLISELQKENNISSWVKFNLSFEKVHKNFSSNLLLKYPSLTPSDIKICSFIRLGMHSKEISSVMNQTTDSIKVSRYRLRKRMELEKGVNLENFLSKF